MAGANPCGIRMGSYRYRAAIGAAQCLFLVCIGLPNWASEAVDGKALATRLHDVEPSLSFSFVEELHGVASALDDGDEKRVAGLRLFSLPRTLQIRVVDTDGEPIAGALVTGEQTKTIKLGLETKRYKFRETTDAKGRFSKVVTKSDVSFGVSVPGYYGYRKTFERGDIPRGELLVTMEREHEPVPVYSSRNLENNFAWREEADTHEIGLQFTGGSTLTGATQWTENRNEADFWLVAEKTGEILLKEYAIPLNDAQWIVTLRGLRGWEIQRGPDGSYGVGKEMRAAPLDGYAEEVSFKGSAKFENNFYVRLNGGERFGKLTEVGFEDNSTIGRISRTTRVGYVVQAEKSNTPSLNVGGEVELKP